MEKKWFFIFILIAIILILSIVIQFTSEAYLQPVPLENCNTLSYNSPESTNLLYFSDKQHAQKYSDYIETVRPFQENSFNTYYIDDVPECELYKEIAVFCHSRSLIKKAASCPNDIIVVFQDKPSKVRSSAYQNVLSVNINHPLTVFPHELGHSLANLAEEYVPADLPKKSMNCQKECNFNPNDGCFNGCSKGDYQRSIENGVMRTLSSNQYGKFNEKLIEEKLLIINPSITGRATLTPSECEDKLYYLIEGIYNQDTEKITVLEKTLEFGCPSAGYSGPVTYKVDSHPGEKFNPFNIFTEAPGGETIDGDVFTSDMPFYLKIPADKKADSLQFTLSGELIGQTKLNDIGARPCKI